VVNKKNTTQTIMHQNNENNYNYNHDTPALTLIELLAVLAILGLLAAILIPTAGKMRSAAHDAACKGHLRQLYNAWTIYGAENRTLPCRFDPKGTYNNPGCDPDPVTGQSRWSSNLERYLGIVHQDINNVYSTRSHMRLSDIMGPTACPADKRKNTKVSDAIAYEKENGVGEVAGLGITNPSYGINLYLTKLNQVAEKRSTRPVEITKNPILLIDSNYLWVDPSNFTTGTNAARFRHNCDSDYDIQADKEWLAGKPLPRLGGHANAVHQDGAIRSYKETELPTAPFPPKRSTSELNKKSGLNGYDIWSPWDAD
jgi:type II secretory pathway pseudopilin PulG